VRRNSGLNATNWKKMTMRSIWLEESETLCTKEKSRHTKEKYNAPEKGPMVEKVENGG
jgi:hypothetical protein